MGRSLFSPSFVFLQVIEEDEDEDEESGDELSALIMRDSAGTPDKTSFDSTSPTPDEVGGVQRRPPRR